MEIRPASDLSRIGYLQAEAQKGICMFMRKMISILLCVVLCLVWVMPTAAEDKGKKEPVKLGFAGETMLRKAIPERNPFLAVSSVDAQTKTIVVLVSLPEYYGGQGKSQRDPIVIQRGDGRVPLEIPGQEKEPGRTKGIGNLSFQPGLYENARVLPEVSSGTIVQLTFENVPVDQYMYLSVSVGTALDQDIVPPFVSSVGSATIMAFGMDAQGKALPTYYMTAISRSAATVLAMYPENGAQIALSSVEVAKVSKGAGRTRTHKPDKVKGKKKELEKDIRVDGLEYATAYRVTPSADEGSEAPIFFFRTAHASGGASALKAEKSWKVEAENQPPWYNRVRLIREQSEHLEAILKELERIRDKRLCTTKALEDYLSTGKAQELLDKITQIEVGGIRVLMQQNDEEGKPKTLLPTLLSMLRAQASWQENVVTDAFIDSEEHYKKETLYLESRKRAKRAEEIEKVYSKARSNLAETLPAEESSLNTEIEKYLRQFEPNDLGTTCFFPPPLRPQEEAQGTEKK